MYVLRGRGLCFHVFLAFGRFAKDRRALASTVGDATSDAIMSVIKVTRIRAGQLSFTLSFGGEGVSEVIR